MGASFSRRPCLKPAAHLAPGGPIVFHYARDGAAEAGWVAARLQRVRAGLARAGQALGWRDVGILVRPNHRAHTMARGLEWSGGAAGGRAAGRFHRHLRPTRPVGDAFAVHGLSDEFPVAHRARNWANARSSPSLALQDASPL